jgi:hypothetical protein
MGETKTTEIPKAVEPSQSNDLRNLTQLGEDIRTATSSPVRSSKPAEHMESLKPGQAGAKFAPGATISQQTKLIVATVVSGLFVLLIFSLVPRWNKSAQGKPSIPVIHAPTPDAVIAVCGQPLADVTKDSFPVIIRTMTYKPFLKDPVVLAFSRTAEEQSQWVFLTMKDQNGPKTYDTMEAQAAALSCLSSKY